VSRFLPAKSMGQRSAAALGSAMNTVTPTIESVLRGLVLLHSAATAWSVGALALTWKRWDHPVIVVITLAAMVASSLTGIVLLLRQPARLLSGRVVAAHFALAVVVHLVDGAAFERGAMFSTRQGIAGEWPLVAVLHVAVAIGPWAGAIAMSLAAARLGGMLANHTAMGDVRRIASIAASATYYGLAGAIAGWIALLLRRSEAQVAMNRAREEVAVTMHDTILQTLALVERKGDPTLVADARRTDRVLRDYLFGSRVDSGRPIDLASALKRAAADAAARFDLDVTVSVVDDERGPPTQVIDALAGAVGEAITNVGKHARATRAIVFAEVDDQGSVTVTVRDDGVGFDPAVTTDRAGLRHSIIERLQGVGGKVTIRSSPGEGTEIMMST
jgi:signal transduction histidine kinase